MFFYREVPQNIVTDGLIYNLDASNYSGIGTTWNDLSGQNNNATLINNPTFNSSGSLSNFAAPSLSEYAEVADVPTRINSPNLSYENVFYYKGIDTFNWLTYKRNPGSPYNQFSMTVAADVRTGGNGKLLCCILVSDNTSDTNDFKELSYDLSINGGARIIHATATGDANSLKLYVNGQLVATHTNPRPSATFNVLGNPTRIGANSTFYLSRLYNRTLTQQEVTQNFEATKNRFGL
jgi:hypothetical protein